MREAVWVFKKDVRRFRFHLCGYLGLMAIFAWLEAGSPRRPGLQQYAWSCEILLLLAAWYLAVMVVHQETVPGDRQYWLTRPISWQSLLLAKAAFVVVFFQFPVLASNLCALVANGLSPLAYVASLLVKQVFLTAFLVLPTMGLAAVTRNFGQFAIWVFAAFGAVLLAGLEFPGTSLGGFFWIVESAAGAVSLAALTGLLVWQYARRRTLLSQTALGGAVLVCAAVQSWNIWHVAFALQSRYARHPAEASAIHLGFDAARDLKPGRGALGTRQGAESIVRILLPVQVTGIPAGMEILSERIAVTAEGPAGARWTSGWTGLGGTLRPTGDNWLLPEDGAYWQYFDIDRAFFERTRNAPLHLRTTAAFTLLSEARTARLTPPAGARMVPNFGFCITRANAGGISSTIGGSLSVGCLAPFQHADWVSLRMQSRRTGQFVTSGTRQDVSYSPYPTALSASMWKPAGANWLAHDPADLDIVLEARDAVAHFERALDVPEIRLAQYRDTPAGAIR